MSTLLLDHPWLNFDLLCGMQIVFHICANDAALENPGQ